ncbi:MAG TPA: hypothetical protein PKC89_02290 [Pyrinomonadaceae bacterium]|nr:hypothetical protein [Pyrinomonadaceae bacterium]
MRIQEMRSGLAHFPKRVDEIDIDEIFRRVMAEPGQPELAALSDLEEPRWSVVSFSGLEAGGLTYKQATALIDELEKHDISGLCIVTDEAAQRGTN